MDTRRAQDLLRHITQDEDYGVSQITKISLAEGIYVINKILPECINKAESESNDNDAGYFNAMMQKYRPIILEKIRTAQRIWIAYSDLTGYPYILDGDLIAIYDYAQHTKVEKVLNDAGYHVIFGGEENSNFKNEIAHMYRNGYKNIRFIGEKMEPFVVAREELYPYETFFTQDYMTNPGLQAALISFVQESKRQGVQQGREEVLKRREDAVIEAIINAEYMVPCTKEEDDDTVEIAHPYVDLTERITDQKDGEQIIAVPVFTDGFEMEKCYEGQYENMLYRFDELADMIDKLDASGIIINCLGIGYYVDKKTMKRIARKA